MRKLEIPGALDAYIMGTGAVETPGDEEEREYSAYLKSCSIRRHGRNYTRVLVDPPEWMVEWLRYDAEILASADPTPAETRATNRFLSKLPRYPREGE
ncbi:hypothetical protein [Streptomyces hoynatensis]|uniref:Uncharacterized protein n=1 Tax=Streptomyces hoynatensis TaxID=1141874 RepID=A0A3A9YFT8_9ACTN|nr:hypothetical protein [Streptomyces hoynatensis]RKN35931.1 hypothetical protein D7294_30340 [Streptomyces hoynatensis]